MYIRAFVQGIAKQTTFLLRATPRCLFLPRTASCDPLGYWEIPKDVGSVISLLGNLGTRIVLQGFMKHKLRFSGQTDIRLRGFSSNPLLSCDQCVPLSMAQLPLHFLSASHIDYCSLFSSYLFSHRVDTQIRVNRLAGPISSIHCVQTSEDLM